MDRASLYSVISEAHSALHSGDVEKAHDILHTVGTSGVVSGTHDPEVQEAVKRFTKYMKGALPCGHTIGDLISGKGMITQCGACLTERNTTKRLAIQAAASSPAESGYMKSRPVMKHEPMTGELKDFLASNKVSSPQPAVTQPQSNNQ